MDIFQLLEQNKERIVLDAYKKVDRIKIKHYRDKEAGYIKQQIRSYYENIEDSVRNQSLVNIVAFAEKVAKERYFAGYDLDEVQAAFNCVEEVIWKKIFKQLKADDFAQAISLISTITGTAKDNLARKYVALVSKTKAPAVDTKELSGYY